MGRLAKSLVAPTLLTIGLAACGDGSAEPESGPSVVEWRVDTRPLATVGTVDGPEEELLSNVAAAVLLPDGGVAIADAGSNTVRIFDGDGEFRTAFGREGEGPGEFQSIFALDFQAPDRLAVYDSGNLRLSTFSLEGELLESVNFRADTGTPELYLGAFSDGGHALAWIEQMGRDPDRVTPDGMAIGRFEVDGGAGMTLQSVDGMWRLGPGPLPFSPHFLAARVADTVYVTNGERPELALLGPDGPVGRSLPLPFERIPAGEARAALADQLTPERQAQLDDLSVPEADSIPLVSDLMSDEAGRLWVKPYDPAADSHWLMRDRSGGTWLALSTSGDVLARLTLPHDLRLLDLTDDRIVGLSRDELGVERVRIHAIRGADPSTEGAAGDG